ncbi:MAG: hypothetical protein ACR2HF_15590 [Methylococcaceae bacterium]
MNDIIEGEAVRIVDDATSPETPAVEMPYEGMPPPSNQMQLPPDVAQAMMASAENEGGTITDPALINFLNGLIVQKQAETHPNDSDEVVVDVDEHGNAVPQQDFNGMLRQYEQLNTGGWFDVVARQNVKGWLSQFDISQSLMKSIAGSILVNDQAWYSLMMVPVYKDQSTSPFIRSLDNKALTKLFKRIDLYQMLACQRDDEWSFGFHRNNQPAAVMKIRCEPNLDYITAAGMALATYLRLLSQ